VHRDALDPGLKEARQDAMENVATLTVRRRDVPRQALLLRGVPLQARPVLLRAAAERLVLVPMTQARRQVAQR
jgi:hypothetical protein